MLVADKASYVFEWPRKRNKTYANMDLCLTSSRTKYMSLLPQSLLQKLGSSRHSNRFQSIPCRYRASARVQVAFRLSLWPMVWIRPHLSWKDCKLVERDEEVGKLLWETLSTRWKSGNRTVVPFAIDTWNVARWTRVRKKLVGGMKAHLESETNYIVE